MSSIDDLLAGGLIRSAVEVVSVLDGRVLGAVPVAQGTLTEDATADVLGRLRITVPAIDDWVPMSPGHPLAAYGQELLVRRGFTDPHGESAGWESLGSYRILPCTAPADGYLEVDAVSPDWRLTVARLVTPMVTTGTAHQQLRALCAGVVPLRILSSVPNTSLGAREWPAEQDRRAAVLEICAVIGATVRNLQGGLTIVPAPTGVTPQRTLRSGRGGTITALIPALSQDVAANAVVAVAESGLASATAVIHGGPRRYDGPYGPVPSWVTSPLLATAEQCAIAARTELERLQSGAPDLEVSAITDPRTRLDSVVRVVTEDTDAVARVVQTTHALTPGQEPGSWRGQVLSGKVRGTFTTPFSIQVRTAAAPEPPPPPPPPPVVLRPTYIGTWTSALTSWTTSTDLTYISSPSMVSGCWWGQLPAGIVTASLTLQSGLSAWTPTLALLAGTNVPTGAPTILATTTGPTVGGPIAAGGSGTSAPVDWELPGTWVAQILSGSAGGVGVVGASGLSLGRARLSGTGDGMSLRLTFI